MLPKRVVNDVTQHFLYTLLCMLEKTLIYAEI